MAKALQSGVPAPTPDAPPQRDNGQVTTEPAVSDWATLPEPIPMPSKVAFTGFTVDVIAKVPAIIRERAEKSLAINTVRVAKAASSDAKRARVDYLWDIQPVPTKERGEEFKALITKYAKYRPESDDLAYADPVSPKGQVTVRCGDPAYYAKAEDGTYFMPALTTPDAFLAVRYSVRPLEQRTATKRLPGTA